MYKNKEENILSLDFIFHIPKLMTINAIIWFMNQIYICAIKML